jgi:glycosyltransferase involved in cell wall biosynthesis
VTTPPTVDVVIDNYNYGRFLRAAIDSALAQTYPCERVIVVDDGSTDESRDVIASYGDRITAVLQANGGQASAFNAGFAHSAADIVIFLDSDDVLLPTTTERVAMTVSTSPTAAKVQYRLEVIDGAGEWTGTIKPPDHLPMPSGDVRRHELTLPFDLTWLPTSGNAFPRWTLERLFPMPEDDFRILADSYLQHVTPLLGPVVSLDWVGGGYRVHGSNSYELSATRLDLQHIRRAVVCAEATRRELLRVAGELRLDHPREILSVADIANRLISRRLAPDLHPIRSDRVPFLVISGWRAAARRFNETAPLRLIFAMWFLAFAVAPKRLAKRLAQGFLFPERRPRLNRVLAWLHRQKPSPG